MNIDSSLSELFDRYLEEDLNILELQDFELRLKDDSGFAESFRLHKEVDNALMEDDILKFRHQLEKLGVRNAVLLPSAPMIVNEKVTPELGQAILQQDIMALREQLSKIHSTVYDQAAAKAVNLDTESSILIADLQTGGGKPADMELSHEVDQAIQEEDVMALRSTLEEIGIRTIKIRKSFKINRKVIAYASSAVAAVFILVFAGSIFITRMAGSYTQDMTFSNYFQAYDGIGNKRGPAEDGNRVIELAIQKYNKGDYTNALELLEATMTNNKSNETVLLYAGSSALMKGDPDKALKYFENWDHNSPVLEQVQWYSASCYLKNNQVEKAKNLLQEISSDPDNYYCNQAAVILKKLGKAKK